MGGAEVLNEPGPHPRVADKNRERDLSRRGPPTPRSQGIPAPHQAPQPRVPVLEREVPITSGCETRRDSSEKGIGFKGPRVLTQTHWFGTAALGQQLARCRGHPRGDWIVRLQDEGGRDNFLSDRSPGGGPPHTTSHGLSRNWLTLLVLPW